MDKTNLKILRILQEKARIPNIEVSRMINLAPSAVLERIRKMEKQGIIDGYEVRLNPEKFGCSQISFLKVFLHAESNHEVVAEKMAKLVEVQEIHFISGDDCYLIKVRTAGTPELNVFLQEKIKTIEGVCSTRTLPVLATHKETAQIPIDK